MAAYLHNDTVPKASLDSIHDLIDTDIALAIQDVPYQIFLATQRKIGPVGAGETGGNPPTPGKQKKKS